MFQAGSVCYPTKLAANSALASQYVGGVFADGRAINVGNVTATSGANQKQIQAMATPDFYAVLVALLGAAWLLFNA